jgi:hypothetical protein
MIRLDLEADRFSDEEMDVGLEELPDGMPALIDLDPRDLPSRDILRAQFAGDLTGSVHPDARDDT